MTKPRQETGAAAVELAAALPLVVFLLMLLVEVGVVMFDQLGVAQAAREGARAAAVSPNPGAAVAAATHATGLNQKAMTVRVGSRTPGALVLVQVSYRSRIVLPFTNQTLVEPVLTSRASMLVEGP